jgi:hypothetical protein
MSRAAKVLSKVSEASIETSLAPKLPTSSDIASVDDATSPSEGASNEELKVKINKLITDLTGLVSQIK